MKMKVRADLVTLTENKLIDVWVQAALERNKRNEEWFHNYMGSMEGEIEHSREFADQHQEDDEGYIEMETRYGVHKWNTLRFQVYLWAYLKELLDTNSSFMKRDFACNVWAEQTCQSLDKDFVTHVEPNNYETWEKSIERHSFNFRAVVADTIDMMVQRYAKEQEQAGIDIRNLKFFYDVEEVTKKHIGDVGLTNLFHKVTYNKKAEIAAHQVLYDVLRRFHENMFQNSWAPLKAIV